MIYLENDDDDQDWGRLQGADETGGNISGLADAAAKPTVTLHKEEEDKTMKLIMMMMRVEALGQTRGCR